ncbi:unnamed protein product [marine sediment metagenome]|uniref:Uncharacterized protein n=1 Tax=marine sediment metagenome TaxID=412755 RepID=X0W6U2_9ZZZZ
MKWKKVITRHYSLLYAYYTQSAYKLLPGFTFKNILAVSKNVTMERYLDEDELNEKTRN